MKQFLYIIISMLIGSVGTIIFTRACQGTDTATVYSCKQNPDSNGQDCIVASFPVQPIQIFTKQLNRCPFFIEEINKKDGHGRKYGLWISYEDRRLNISQYSKGVLNGIEQIYSFVDDCYRLSYIVNYKQGQLTSPAIRFDDYGLVDCMLTNVSPVDTFSIYVPEWMKERYSLDSINQAYSISYDYQGRMESEGWTIFPKDEWEIEFEMVGEHLYYGPDGTPGGTVVSKILYAPQ